MDLLTQERNLISCVSCVDRWTLTTVLPGKPTSVSISICVCDVCVYIHMNIYTYIYIHLFITKVPIFGGMLMNKGYAFSFENDSSGRKSL